MAVTTADKANIVSQYQRAAGDTGSPEVQVALLTTRINGLTDHFKANVKDLKASMAFYEKLGFRQRGGNPAQNWVVMRNGDAIVGLYTSDPGVASLAFELFPILIVFHWFDAIQCSATQSLRGYRQTLVPMLIYAFALWGIGLGVGYVLAFAPWTGWWPATALGAPGFWWAQAASLAVAAAALHWEFARISRSRAP